MSKGDRSSADGERYESLASAVVAEIAAQERTDPAELDPSLYEILDPDALNALFAPTKVGHARSSGRVEFSYCGYNVTAYSDGHVHVQEPTDPTNTDFSKGKATHDK